MFKRRDERSGCAAIRLLIAGDVSKQGFTLSFKGTAAKGGRLEKVIRRQEPGQPFGARLMPASSWLYLSDRGNPEAKAEGLAIWEPAIKKLLSGLKKDLGPRSTKAVTEALELLTGDVALALHRAPSGSGMTAEKLMAGGPPIKIATRNGRSAS